MIKITTPSTFLLSHIKKWNDETAPKREVLTRVVALFAASFFQLLDTLIYLSLTIGTLFRPRSFTRQVFKTHIFLFATSLIATITHSAAGFCYPKFLLTYSSFQQKIAFPPAPLPPPPPPAPKLDENLYHLNWTDYVQARQSLEKGIRFSPQIIARLTALMPELLKEKPDSHRIQWIGRETNAIFKLKGLPNLVFKLPKDAHEDANRLRFHNRFENMVRCEDARLKHRLNHLIIPKAQELFIHYKGKHYLFVVEKALKIDPSQEEQKLRYSSKYPLQSQQYKACFEKSVDQIITFIEHTGMSDIFCHNIPLLDNGMIALIDTEYLDNITGAFLGVHNSPSLPRKAGLIKIMPTAELVQKVTDAAIRLGVDADLAREKQQERLAELAALVNQ